jgi:ABC-type lipoprotein release transport system permease subunit
MTFGGLWLRSLVYHWRGNLAVLLGVAVGSAVLTGALLVGDSLRGSLRALSLDQLGWVDQAMVTGRFFRSELAGQLSAERTAPAILLQGTARVPAHLSKVTVLGVDERFWPGELSEDDKKFWQSDRDEVVINAALGEALSARVGDTITLSVQKADHIPRESLLGKRKVEDVVMALPVKVRKILPDEVMARFTLKPSPEPARNAFLPLRMLQERLQQPGRANAVLAAGTVDGLRRHVTADDWGLRLRSPDDRARALVRFLHPRKQVGPLKPAQWRGRVPEALAKKAQKGELSVDQVVDYYRKNRAYLSLESRQMFLEPAVAEACRKIQEFYMLPHFLDRNLRLAPVLVYLADTLSDGKAEIPYAVVAALNTERSAPLGPFQPAGTPPLGDDEIILADWSESPLSAKPGDPITIAFYAPDDLGQLKKETKRFTLRYKVPLEGAADDPDLTPEFPGITDKLSMGTWEKPPFPYDPKRIKPADERYWQRYRTTPRAYVTLAAGQRLWSSRFGSLTSVRIAGWKESDPPPTAKEFEEFLLGKLNLEQGGFVFQDVKEQALKAGAGSTDFGILFLAFSCFLIVAALMLVGLLVRLNLDRRAPEIGLLLAVGCRRRTVLYLLLAEGATLAVVGGVIGLVGAVGYAGLLLDFLSERWPGEQPLTFLHFHGRLQSYLIGYLSALAVSVLTILWALRVLAGVSPKGLLAGGTTPDTLPAKARRIHWSLWVAGISAVGAAVSLAAGFLVTGHEAQAMSFFGSGTFLLIAILAAVWRRMRAVSRASPLVPRPYSLGRLGVRNAARHPVRSLLTVGLLAAAAFLVVAVQSFHQEAGAEFYEKTGGSGGFRLLAESDVPIFQDLNSSKGRSDLFPDQVPEILETVTFYPFRVRAGDDASCLNLYQPLKPRILGVPESLIRRGGFDFSGVLRPSDAEKQNPWRLLERTEPDGAIPVLVDANTAQWILHVGLGDVYVDRDSNRKLRIVGLLRGSIFQSELLMADAQFRKLFPRQEGFGFFLIEGPPDKAGQVKSALDSAAAALFVTPTARRLEAYLAVENTYLATFQALGGFGLLLGALGLAVVLLRGVWERRGELALLRALGFRRRSLGWLVLAENGYLLILGLGAGVLAALLAVAPHLIGSGTAVLWLQMLVLLGLVLLVGLGAATAAVAATLRAPLLNALRRE